MLLCSLCFSLPALALPQQLYVWNRLWSPQVRGAIRQFGDVAGGWRVLVAESDAAGGLKPVAVDWVALAATHKPVIAVVRIDGQLALNNANPERVAALVKGLPATVSGIEIDHDCGVARLAAYARFLNDLRGRVIPRRLSITALPAWLEARDLHGVLAATDEVVLQVHAVRAPGAGLFDPRLARLWTDTLSRRDVKPFHVAVPDYATQVIRDDNGALLAVESEMPRLAGGAATQDLLAQPADVASFVRDLTANPPHGFVGLVWFRLPAAGDARIWSPATLKQVMRGDTPQDKLSAALLPGDGNGAFDVGLSNDGDADALLPSALVLPSGCAPADGVNGYALRATGGGYSLVRLQNGLLRAHHRRIVGWARCRDLSSFIQIHP